jgi:hypothetical protein
MKKKIIGIFVCMLMIATALTATGAMNFQATWLVNENNYFQPNQNTPANSPSLITINIVAKVYSVDDPDNLLGGVIKINDTIKGKYTYDSNATDTEPDPAIGIYWYYSSPCRIEIKAGGFVFKTDPNNVEFGIGVANDLVYPYPQGDMYEIASFNNSNLSNGYIVTGIDWLLYDPSGTALSSDSLPTTAPVLSKWNQSTTGFGLTFNAFNPSNNSHFYIKADVTKATKSRARDAYFTTQPVLIWLLERFQNLFPILRHLIM